MIPINWLFNRFIFISGNPAGKSNPSRTAPVADDDGIPVFDHRHLALAVGNFEHFLQFVSVFLHVEIVVGRVSLPGFVGVRSTRLAVDDDLAHVSSFELEIENKRANAYREYLYQFRPGISTAKKRR